MHSKGKSKHKHHVTKTYEGLEIKLHAFLTSVLYRSEWSASPSDRFTPVSTRQ